MTVVETDRFLRDAHQLIPEAQRMDLVAFVAANPRAGDLIPGTGGVRKLRWALPGRGKRGRRKSNLLLPQRGVARILAGGLREE